MTTKAEVWWDGMLGHKIEVAEACGGVVTLRVDQARTLNAVVLQHNALADALGRIRAMCRDDQDPDLRYFEDIAQVADAALRAAGRLPEKQSQGAAVTETREEEET